MTYLHELEDQGHDDLAPMFRRRLNSAQFVAHVIDPQTPYRVKFDISAASTPEGVRSVLRRSATA